ncbi:tetratricopeptide repeat protein [Collinsella sp. An2]|uniref:tetratricopeptide repeat protein n=1 Tax=Collinsella sp. An2 TaxID=1965585 RepID=UPI000B39EFD9|nr:tetratricopeptide repeat protein [Collinsella sp. An2]OUP08268.1 hypothetical protein B5F33_07605 [Collinsella sp. An2]
MNAQLLDQARAAYRAGDYSTAAQMFAAVKDPSEVRGEVDHLRGNALMKLGMWSDAAAAYSLALQDASYGKKGALLTNQGKAYAAAGDQEAAARCFTEATKDTTYATPYKAYLGLGGALLALGRVAEAGTAYRQAAIDGANPAPAGALAQLGACFVKLGRPGDAIESYRTALDFATPRDDTRSINAGMGEALCAANRYSDAVDAFTAATSDGIYQLTPEQQTSLTQAQDALDKASAQRAMAPTAAQGVPDKVDPLDPLGKSGAFMPDPSDTGFFTLTESEMIQQDKREMKVRRRHRHLGLKIFLVILLLLIIAAGGLGFAYTRGFGFPSQQDTLTSLFQAVTDDADTDAYLASGLSDDAKAILVSSIPADATPVIEAMDQSMTESTAQVTVQLSRGGTMTYEVSFVRSDNHIGWVVSNIAMDLGGDSTSTDDDTDAATLDDEDTLTSDDSNSSSTSDLLTSSTDDEATE